MADRTNEAVVEDDKADAEVVVPAKDPVKGLKQANRTLQTERDNLAKQLAEAKEAEAKSKRTAEEQAKVELENIRKERDQARAEAAAALKERETERRVSTMVAKHGLKDPDYGELVLKGFNPDEHDDFDAFVTLAKKNKKFEPLFNKVEEEARVTDEDGEEVIPAAPRANKSKAPGAGSKLAQAEHEEFARTRWPGDEAKQKAYVATVTNLGRGR